MLKDLDYKLKLLCETAVLCENEFKIRNLCSEIVANAQDKKDHNAVNVCRKKLRCLENEKCRNAKSVQMKELDLARLIENLSLCSDIILSDMGKKVSCEAEKCTISCCPKIIINAFMNLISNCAKFGRDNFINISLRSLPDSTVITARNSGTMDFSKVKGGGIAAASNIARLHKGRLFYASGNNSVEAALCIPQNEKAKQKYNVPDYTAFLTDEFSPVHIGLSDIFPQ